MAKVENAVAKMDWFSVVYCIFYGVSIYVSKSSTNYRRVIDLLRFLDLILNIDILSCKYRNTISKLKPNRNWTREKYKIS